MNVMRLWYHGLSWFIVILMVVWLKRELAFLILHLSEHAFDRLHDCHALGVLAYPVL